VKRIVILTLFLSLSLAACSDSTDEVDVDDLTLAARRGDPAAQYKLGMYYLERHQTRNPVLAVEWLARAGEQGHVEAILRLASTYETDNYRIKDVAKAEYWYKKAVETLEPLAEQGDRNSRFHLARFYDEGKPGIPRDAAKSYAWYAKIAEGLRERAERGEAAGQFFLGAYYEGGHGVPQDIDEAVKWYKKSAETDGDSKLGWRKLALERLQKIEEKNEQRENADEHRE